jgi:hypothetical protein
MDGRDFDATRRIFEVDFLVLAVGELSLRTLVVPPVPTVGLCIFAIDGTGAAGPPKTGG